MAMALQGLIWMAIDVVRGAVTMKSFVWVDTAAVVAKCVPTPFSTNVCASDVIGNVVGFVWMPTVVVDVVGTNICRVWCETLVVDPF